MTWARIDDKMPFNDKILAAGNEAVGVWARLLAWCAGQLTDGAVPHHVAVLVAGKEGVLERLCVYGLLMRRPDGFQVSSYLKWNESREQILARRDADAARKKVRTAARPPLGDELESRRNPDGIQADAGGNPGRDGMGRDGMGSGNPEGGVGEFRQTQRCDLKRLEQSWVTVTGRLAVDGLLDFALLVETAAPAIVPLPAHPDEYAEKCIAAFNAWVDGIREARRPQKTPRKLIEHFARVQAIVAGEIAAVPVDEPPKPPPARNVVPPVSKVFPVGKVGKI